MIHIVVRLKVRSNIARVWSRLTDWPANSEWIPATKVTVTKQTLGVGTEFVGITKIGPLTLPDPMRVIQFNPPMNGRASARVTKLGPPLEGEAGFDLRDLGEDHTELVWFETVSTRWARTERLFSLPIRLVGWLAFRYALGRFAKAL